MNYPKGETVWLTAHDKNREIRYIITSPPDRHVYYLYTPEPDGSWKRWGKDTSAGRLEQRYLNRRCQDAL